MSARRWVVATVAIVVAGTTAPGPADARAVATGSPQTVSFSTTAGAGGGCDVNGQLSGADPRLEVPIDGKVRELSLDRSGVLDMVNLHEYGHLRARATRSARGVVRADLDATVTSSVSPQQDHRCPVQLSAYANAGVEVDITRRSWLVIRRKASSTNGDSGASLAYNGATNTYFPLEGVGTLTRLVPPGHYEATNSAMASNWLQPGQGPSTRTTTLDATLSFIPVGTRRSLTGTGTGLISVGHRDCSRNRVAASFSRAARTRLRSATFAVDGKRRVVLRGRQVQRSSLVLGSIARKGPGKISVQMVLKSGARRVTASTSWHCA